jgi:DNA polymerase I-like protein with 3'-5' exonuclease and polymerase domains
MKLSPSVILNTTVQGSAAIGMKKAILVAEERGLMEYVGATVHDELVACVPNAMVEEYSKELEEAMLEGMRQTMPGMYAKVEVKSGDYWQT